MTLEDPFFVVKEEVLKALERTRKLYDQWRQIKEPDSNTEGFALRLRSPEEVEWMRNELRNSLRSIEWDLEDLEDTVKIVEANPSKFKINSEELGVRKRFIDETREEVSIMKKSIEEDQRLQDNNSVEGTENNVSTAVLVAPPGSKKYTRLAGDSPTKQQEAKGSGFVADALEAQRRIVREQDERLTQMSSSVGSLHGISATIGSELDEQAVMLDEFGAEIENAESKLDGTMRKMAKVFHMSNDRRQWMAIGGLSGLIVVLMLLIFAF